MEATGPPSSDHDAPLPVLVNARAGRSGDGVARRVERLLHEEGVAAEVRTVAPERLEAELTAAVRRGLPRVAVAGGDGSLFTAAGALAGSGTALAPIPTGTLNHFARRVGADSVEAGVRALAGSDTSPFPAGVVDDRLFLNTATFGLYADVVRRRERLRGWLGKWPAAAAGFAIRLARLQQLELELVANGECLRRVTPLVWVGMGWGSFPRVHAARERRDHPDLEIVVVRRGSRVGLLALLGRLTLRLLRGKVPTDDAGLEVLHARYLIVRSRHRVGVTLDGEVLRLRGPIWVGVQDDALLVVTGPGERRGVSLAPGPGP